MSRIGISKNIVNLMYFINEDEKNNINEFYKDCISRSYKEFSDIENALMNIDGSSYSSYVRDILSDYSGYNYRRINASAREKWNYDSHGHINEKVRFDEIAANLKKAIDDNQKSIGNVKVFRGVPLKYFKEYGISSLDELQSLKGSFLYDKGFVSTSLVEDKCFYKKTNELGLDYNVKIEYLVPEEFEDGISISNVSYSSGQCEYLINTCNLSYVDDVISDGDNNAIIRAMLIPKRIYDKSYRNNLGSVK